MSAWKTPVERRSTCDQLWVCNPIQLSVGVGARLKMAAKMATCDCHVPHYFFQNPEADRGQGRPQIGQPDPDPEAQRLGARTFLGCGRSHSCRNVCRNGSCDNAGEFFRIAPVADRSIGQEPFALQGPLGVDARLGLGLGEPIAGHQPR